MAGKGAPSGGCPGGCCSGAEVSLPGGLLGLTVQQAGPRASPSVCDRRERGYFSTSCHRQRDAGAALEASASFRGDAVGPQQVLRS